MVLSKCLVIPIAYVRSQNAKNFQLFTVEPRYNWQNLFAIMRFRYIEVLVHIFYCY